jgi:drug/metabolite transporter (DMT)-like permease
VNLSPHRLALLAAAGTGMQAGAAVVASRVIVVEVGPWSLAWLRYTVALLCLLPFLLLRPAPARIRPRDVLPLAVLGGLQMGGLIGLLNLGLLGTTASRAALLLATFPLMTMLIGAALGREAMTARRTAGTLLTVAGVACVLGEAVGRSGNEREWLGILTVLAAAFLGGLCSVLSAPFVARNPVREVSAVGMLATVIALCPAMLAEGTYPGWAALGWTAWALVAFVGVSSTVGFLLWFTALRLTTPTNVTIFMALSPIVSVVLEAALLGRSATPGLLLGTALVLGGLWTATRTPRP